MAAVSNGFLCVFNRVAEDRHFTPRLGVSPFLSIAGTPVCVRCARLQDDVDNLRRLHGTDLKPNSDKDLIVIRIIRIKGDNAELSFLQKIPGVEDDLSTLSRMMRAEYYVRDSRMMLQVDGMRHTASLESRKK